MHPAAKDILAGFGRVALRAGARAVESVLRDVERGLRAGEARVKQTRYSVRQIDPDEEEEEES